MKKIKCHIVEDEPLAAELMANYIAQVTYLELNGISYNAMEAHIFLKDHPVDLIFLDLHLPSIRGFDFLKSFINPPPVIVTTAYTQYALQGYEFNIVDYLVKPISYPRFLQAINKLTLENSENLNKPKPIYFKHQRKNVPVFPDQIVYVESKGDYVHVHLQDKIISSKQTLQSTQEKLDTNQFIRLHRSFLVAIEKIESWNHEIVFVNGKKLPIGRTYKERFLKKMKSLT
ncbi:MAG: LytTR family DNA-binding domain-containing protein [Bacteroidota bacterium]